MSNYKNIKISDYNYPLPDSRIAKYPLKERDTSNLLIWNKGIIKKEIFKNISSYIPSESMLVFNNTRVIHARLFFKKETGAKIEIFCLEPITPADYQFAFQQKNRVIWKCMLGNAKKWKNGTLSKYFEINGEQIKLTANKNGKENNAYIIEFKWNGDITFAEIIEKIGVLPIPPYLNRETEPEDEDTYQTVYAKTDGSVAAPTAGLHFTNNVIRQLNNKNIETNEITLHVGAGTFKPVKSETIEGHDMHHEKVSIPKSLIEKFINTRKKIIAVGTTSVRSLESLYWIGVKLEKNNTPENLNVKQWEPYELNDSIDVKKAFKNIISYLDRKGEKNLVFSTQIIIVPGYNFKLINGMITNFHQPQSTLLLLISAFLGNKWKTVYKFALENNFRFLSYGDSNLYLK